MTKPLRRGPYSVPIEDRLWARISFEDECWLWEGALNNHGYGVIGTGRNQATMYTHRLVWMLFYGDPGIFNVLHKCDNPRCCRPEHLFLGTQADNVWDMQSKLRAARSQRKLTSEQEREVMTSQESSAELARRLPMSASGIRRLRQKGGYHYGS